MALTSRIWIDGTLPEPEVSCIAQISTSQLTEHEFPVMWLAIFTSTRNADRVEMAERFFLFYLLLVRIYVSNSVRSHVCRLSFVFLVFGLRVEALRTYILLEECTYMGSNWSFSLPVSSVSTS